MSTFAWSEKYSVNIREIDDQHKKLIEMISDLHSAMRQGKGKEALDKILKDLIQYTRVHFAAEEKILRDNGYPDFDVHKAKHDSMTNKVADIFRDYQDGKAAITFAVMDFLEKWIDKHIMGTDKNYSSFLNGKGVS